MFATAVHSVRNRSILELSRVGRFASKFLVLAIALLYYGVAPSTVATATEYEAQIQEEATASAGAHVDLRTKLRGSAHRRAGATVIASAARMSCRRIAEVSSAEHLGPQISLGLAVPLRC